MIEYQKEYWIEWKCRYWLACIESCRACLFETLCHLEKEKSDLYSKNKWWLEQ